jgi:SAM-dependent methyltransferase
MTLATSISELGRAAMRKRRRSDAWGPGDHDGSVQGADDVRKGHTRPRPDSRSFWESQVAISALNRRITGDTQLSPAEYFVREHCRRPIDRALSLRWGQGTVERVMLGLGAIRQLVAFDMVAENVDRGPESLPPKLATRVQVLRLPTEPLRIDGPFGLVIANGVLSHLERPAEFFVALERILEPDGMLYVDEYVGPSRFQWTDQQLRIINRLLGCLSPELRRDLVSPRLGIRSSVMRMPMSAGEAPHSAEIPALLRSRFEPVEERQLGGAVYHQLFNRIMGNFDGHDDLVRVLMEFDAILTDEQVVDSDYLWGVYRFSSHRRPAEMHSGATGRLDAIEEATLVGWAADPDNIGEQLSLDVYVDHRLIGKTVACLPRSDLAREAIGDGGHAFRIRLPSWVRDGAQHSLSVVASSLDVNVLPARGWGERNRSLPDGTEFVWAERRGKLRPPPPARALFGGDGWAFPCDDEVGSLAQMLGELTLTEPELVQWATFLGNGAAQLSNQGVRYAVAVIPAKAGVYPEMLPACSPPLQAPRLAHQLELALAGTHIRIIDLVAPLITASRKGHELYYRHDATWNHRGALAGAQAILRSLRDTGLVIPDLNDDTIEWREENFVGELAGKPGIVLENGRLRPVAAVSQHETAWVPEEARLACRGVPPPAHATDYDADAVLMESSGAAHVAAVILHDRPGDRMVPFLAPVFARSLWLGRRSLPDELIAAERPTLILQILDEAQLVRVPYAH